MIAPGVGTVVGAIAFGILGGITANSLAEYLTKWIFDLAPTTALDHAYVFFELSPSCTNDEVNRRFRQLALVLHPDKGGSYEKWLQLQVYQQSIKMSREGR